MEYYILITILLVAAVVFGVSFGIRRMRKRADKKLDAEFADMGLILGITYDEAVKILGEPKDERRDIDAKICISFWDIDLTNMPHEIVIEFYDEIAEYIYKQ